MKKTILTKAFLVAAGLLVGASAWAADNVVNIPLSGHVAIMGTKNYQGQVDSHSTEIYLSSYAAYGGAGAMSFTLDNDFDASKVKSAYLKIYVTGKSNKNYSCTVNFYALDAMPVPSETVTAPNDYVKIYSYGTDKNKRYAYPSGTTVIATQEHSAYTNSTMKTGVYTDINITDYVKGLTKKAGDPLYIGIDITDAVVSTYLAGYGNANASYLEITYTSDKMADYTINYQKDGVTVKSTKGNDVVNSTISAVTAIDGDDGKHYLTVSNEAASITLQEGENVLNVPVRVPYTATINVSKTFGESTVVDTKTFTESDDRSTAWSYYYSIYEQNEGSWYLCDADTYGWSGTFTDGEVIEKSVNYPTIDRSIVYFNEGENGGYVVSSGDATASGGGTGAVKADNARNRGFSLGTLAAGNYQLIVKITEVHKRSLGIRIGTNDYFVSITPSYSSDLKVHTIDFTLDEETSSLYINGANSGDSKLNQSESFDYLIVRKNVQDVAVTSIGYATFCPSVNLDFSTAENVEACTASVATDGKITYTVVNTVKAGEGVLLRSKDGGEASELIPVIAEATANTDNAFVGIPAKVKLAQSTEEGYTNYILSKVGDVLGFYKVNTNGSWCNAGTAYLKVANSVSPARGFFALWNEDTTGINAAAATSNSIEGQTYNLNGQRVAQPAKGLYIVNGKKVVIK